ncbi:MAG: DNA polymerase III subunit delta [Geodermatophilaceae bacterium]|jgi:DNA polymerase-3 subunit delta|nr:DNA polymerase III subunit delta [Geodermatophilaceae bacterium]
MTDEHAVGAHLALGDDEFLRSRTSADLVAAARAADSALEVQELNASGSEPGQLAEMLGLSLFAQRRLVLIEGTHDAAKDFAEAVAQAVEARDSDLVLVLTHSGGARNKALVDRVKRAGATVHDCAKLTRHEDRLRFIRREAQRAGGSISAAAAAAILDAVGNDLRELSAATGQLVFDAGGEIEVDDVARYHRGRAEITGFSVAERALVGDLPAALEALRWALDQGVAAVLIADALADGVRTAARVVSVGRGDPYDLARTLGLPPWKVKRAQQQARGWKVTGLHEALQIVAKVNADVKGVAASADYALESAVRQLIAAKESSAVS